MVCYGEGGRVIEDSVGACSVVECVARIWTRWNRHWARENSLLNNESIFIIKNTCSGVVNVIIYTQSIFSIETIGTIERMLPFYRIPLFVYGGNI